MQDNDINVNVNVISIKPNQEVIKHNDLLLMLSCLLILIVTQF